MDTRTHYLPMFHRVSSTAVQHDGEGHLQAICGSWIRPEQHKVDPAELTCWGCRAWIENLNLIEKES